MLVSGSGTNLQAILDACRAPDAGPGSDARSVDAPWLDAEVVLVVSNNPEAFAIERAKSAGVPTSILPHQGRDRDE
ncbi:MAG: formyltransferase family protein, partial [Acidimicrobiales bacterium]